MHYVLIKELSVNDKDIHSTDIFHSPRQNCTYWYVEAWCEIWQKHHDLTQKNARLDTKLTQYIAVATEIVKHFHPFKSLSPFLHIYNLKNTTPGWGWMIASLMFWRNHSSWYPSLTGQTDTKPTSNRQKSSNSGRDRFTVGIDSVLSVWCRFMFGKRSFKHVSKISPRQIVGCLSVICRRGVGSVGERSGTCRS